MDPKKSILETELNRRTAVGVAAGAVAGGAALRASAQGATPEASPSASPVASPVLDNGLLKSSVEGVPDAVITPPEPFKSYEGTPANGGTVRYSHLIYGSAATAYDNNTFWKELETRLGVDRFEVNEIPVAAYDEKLSAMIASNDMGDMIYLLGSAAVVNRATSEGAFVDLTDHLTGDNLQKYPNLAALPSAMWEDSKINGRIYGIPQPIYQGSNITFKRQDWMENLGIEEPKNADDYTAIFDAFTNEDPDGNGSNDTHAMAWTQANFINPMFRVPNWWRQEEDGTLIHQYETEEYRLALDFRRNLWEMGTIHPDAPSNTQQQMRDLFFSGRTGIMSEGFGTWWGPNGTIETIKKSNPDAVVEPFLPIGYDGEDGYTYPLGSYYGTVAIPSTVGEDRVEELLRICDYMYPPFGSEEYIFHVWGIEGEHHTVDENGDRFMTTKGEADISGLLYGFVVQDLYIYHPGFPDHAQRRQEIIEITKQYNVFNPTQGLYSEIAGRVSPVIDQIMADAIEEYVLGRADADALDVAIERWRNEGGNEMREDYQRLMEEHGRV